LSSNTSRSTSNPSTNPTLDKINSLLLGKTPLYTPHKSRISSPGKEESYGCVFGHRTVDDSWVEISMNPGSNLTHDGEQESDSIRKINLLLNGSTDLLPESGKTKKLSN